MFRANEDINGYFPLHIENMEEFQQIATSYNDLIEEVWQELERTYDNNYLDTMDAVECSRHEEILGIHPNPGDSLDDRRRRIKGYYASDLPYTKLKLNESLKAMCGDGFYHLTVNTVEKTVTVGLELESVPMISIVTEILQRMVPADMVIRVYVIYNRYREFKTHTHGQLRAYSHLQIRQAEVFDGE